MYFHGKTLEMVEVNDEQSSNVEGNGEDTDDVDDNAYHDDCDDYNENSILPTNPFWLNVNDIDEHNDNDDHDENNDNDDHDENNDNDDHDENNGHDESDDNKMVDENQNLNQTVHNLPPKKKKLSLDFQQRKLRDKQKHPHISKICKLKEAADTLKCSEIDELTRVNIHSQFWDNDGDCRRNWINQ